VTTRSPLRRSHQARKPPPAPGNPVPADASGTDLPLPHERDQSTGQTDPRPNKVMRQAKADIDKGLVDTDLRATPGLDAQQREKLLKPKRR
jgi:hypothetical protein